jgi:hypothetical protein
MSSYARKEKNNKDGWAVVKERNKTKKYCGQSVVMIVRLPRLLAEKTTRKTALHQSGKGYAKKKNSHGNFWRV